MIDVDCVVIEYSHTTITQVYGLPGDHHIRDKIKTLGIIKSNWHTIQRKFHNSIHLQFDDVDYKIIAITLDRNSGKIDVGVTKNDD